MIETRKEKIDENSYKIIVLCPYCGADTNKSERLLSMGFEDENYTCCDNGENLDEKA